MHDLYVNPRLTIPSRELEISTARSSGPGGQNVNKVNSKVTLKWAPGESDSLDPHWRRRLVGRFGNRINREGRLVLHSQRFRDQSKNLADVRARLAEMLLACATAPPKRQPTRPTHGSELRRLEAKKQRSQKKALRRRPLRDD